MTSDQIRWAHLDTVLGGAALLRRRSWYFHKTPADPQVSPTAWF
jgi:hypothetical protein